MRSPAPLWTVLFLLPAGLLAAAAAAAQELDPDAWRRDVARARILLKKGEPAEALAALKSAVSPTGGGDDEPEAWTMLGLASEELFDLRAARDAFRKATDLADAAAAAAPPADPAAGPPSDAGAEARAALQRMDTTYGEAILDYPGWTPEGKISLDYEGMLLDPRAKVYLARLQASLQSGQVPTGAVVLPAGQYRLAGFAFEVVAGESRRIAVLPPRKRPGAVMVELAGAATGLADLGGGGGLGPLAGGVRLGFAPRLAPLARGALRVALRGTFEATGARSDPDAYTGEEAAGAAVRAGGELGVAVDLKASSALAVVPAVGYGVSYLSGAWFPAVGVLDGGPGAAEPGQARLPALAHGPAVRVGVTLGGRGTAPAFLVEGGAEVLMLRAGAVPDGIAPGGADGLGYAGVEAVTGRATWLAAGVRAGLVLRR